jgi:hypothetical protein
MRCREGRIGFLRIMHRVNVLLSRARHGMYLLGNPDSLLAASKHQNDIWPQVQTLPLACCLTFFDIDHSVQLLSSVHATQPDTATC